MIGNGTDLMFSQWLAYQVAGDTLLTFDESRLGIWIGVEQLGAFQDRLVIAPGRWSQNVTLTSFQQGLAGLAR